MNRERVVDGRVRRDDDRARGDADRRWSGPASGRPSATLRVLPVSIRPPRPSIAAARPSGTRSDGIAPGAERRHGPVSNRWSGARATIATLRPGTLHRGELLGQVPAGRRLLEEQIAVEPFELARDAFVADDRSIRSMASVWLSAASRAPSAPCRHSNWCSDRPARSRGARSCAPSRRRRLPIVQHDRRSSLRGEEIRHRQAGDAGADDADISSGIRPERRRCGTLVVRARSLPVRPDVSVMRGWECNIRAAGGSRQA